MDKSIKKDGVKNLSLYESKISKKLFFVNGFAVNMITKSTDVIYTNVLESIPLTLPVDKFKSNFKIIK